MLNPPKLKTIEYPPISLEDFEEDDDYCHACHGCDDRCTACRILRMHRHNYYRELRRERIADER